MALAVSFLAPLYITNPQTTKLLHILWMVYILLSEMLSCKYRTKTQNGNVKMHLRGVQRRNRKLCKLNWSNTRKGARLVSQESEVREPGFSAFRLHIHCCMKLSNKQWSCFTNKYTPTHTAWLTAILQVKVDQLVDSWSPGWLGNFFGG